MSTSNMKDFFTLVEKNDWNKFARDLVKYTPVKWCDGDELDEYNPFTAYSADYKILISCDTSDGTLAQIHDFDIVDDFVSHQEFLKRATSIPVKKEESTICCFVEKQIWGSFVKLLELNKDLTWGENNTKPSKWYPFTNANEDGVFIIAYSSELGIELYRSDIEDFDTEVELLTKTEFLERVLIKEDE